MLNDAQAFWAALRPKVREEIRAMTQNVMRRERYDVSTPPNGNVIGVKIPFGTNEIFLPYDKGLKDAQEGDAVLVEWRGTLSTARAVSFGDGAATGGTSDHGELTNREAADQHPISAITGLSEALNGKAEIRKLWENASPRSTFTSQTIQVPGINQYDFIIISATYSQYESVDCSVAVRATVNSGGYLSSARAVNGYSVYAQSRYFSVIENGVSFEDAYILQNGGTASADNRSKIPLFILGIKGVT